MSKVGDSQLTHKEAFNRRHGYDPDMSHSLRKIASISKLKFSVLQKVYNRGVGAFNTNPSSVRPFVKSKEQWAAARVYSFVNKLESGMLLNHDTDLVK